MLGTINNLDAYKHQPPIYKRYSTWASLAIIVIILFIFFLRTSPRQKPMMPLSVVTAIATRMDVPVYLTGLGAVTPTTTATIRTQLSGQLLQVLFKEGQWVKQGEVLAQIDPRPYQAQLSQYIGQLARDQALLDNANRDLKRYNELWKQDSVSRQVLDTQVALVAQLKGTVHVDQALIDSTNLNLMYCKITSPVSGRIGLRLVDAGNYVQPSDVNGIAVVNTLDPITVIFSLPEDNIPQIMAPLREGKTLEVSALDRAQYKILAHGTLLTVDNQVDPTTGTVKLRAQFNNEKNALFPSQFVNARLRVDTLKQATVIPTSAIQNGKKGPFVYRVEKDKVHVTPVDVGVTIGDSTSINKGIEPGQAIVTEGADKLTEGATVSIASGEQAFLELKAHSENT
jgi:multidrug efflux system membrane fusion protein